jgi:putative DNA primase/helicase
MLTAALDYAAEGFSVFPLQAGSKVPATAHGFKDASAGPEQIARWFSPDNDVNIGIPTGQNNLFVLDVDLDKLGAPESFAELQAMVGTLTATRTAKTPHGVHYWFSVPAGGKMPGNHARFAGLVGIDIRGAGGYVVAPPSRLSDGEYYEWLDYREPVEAPAELMRLLDNPHPGKRKAAAATGHSIPEGARNHGMFGLACGFVRDGLGEAEIRARVKAENLARCQPPLDDSEVDAIVASALRYPPKAETTELSLTRRLVDVFDGKVRYDYAAKEWLFFDGRKWCRDRDGVVMRHAKGVVDDLLAEARSVEGEGRKAAVAAARRAARASSLKAILELASTEPGVGIDASIFDANGHLVNVLNGTIDLRTGQLLPHDPAMLCSKLIPVDYYPDAPCHGWLKVLDEVSRSDSELVAYLQRLAGLLLSGYTREQVFHILLGHGSNGKTLVGNALAHAFGEYSYAAPASLLLVRQSGAATNDLVALKGKRLVLISEANPADKVDAALLKRLTGGEEITARALYSEYVTFTPQASFVWGMNHLPHLDADDAGLWRRARVIPFNRVFTADEQDHSLAETLRAEAPGILAWAVAGARMPLGTCAAVEAATAAARAEGDEVGSFLADHCEVGAVFVEEAGQLMYWYRHHTENNGAVAMSPTAFGRVLTRRGFTTGKVGGKRVRIGLQLKKEGRL